MSAMYMLSAMKTKYTEYSMNTVYTGNTMSIAYKLYSQYTKFTRSIMIIMSTKNTIKYLLYEKSSFIYKYQGRRRKDLLLCAFCAVSV